MNKLVVSITCGLLGAVIGSAIIGAEGKCVDLLRDRTGKASLSRWACFHDPAVKSCEAVWRLEHGVLRCKGLPKGYLYTKRGYKDLELKLEWRWPPGSKPGHGGVLLRVSGEHKVWPRSLEVQLNAGSEGDLIGLNGYRLGGPAGRTRVVAHKQFGRLTFVKRSTVAVKEPGQWNVLEVRLQGPDVVVRMNGKEVNRASGCESVAGPIVLTAEGEPIEFRRIELRVR
jgi:hypothetical protein